MTHPSSTDTGSMSHMNKIHDSTRHNVCNLIPRVLFLPRGRERTLGTRLQRLIVVRVKVKDSTLVTDSEYYSSWFMFATTLYTTYNKPTSHLGSELQLVGTETLCGQKDQIFIL